MYIGLITIKNSNKEIVIPTFIEIQSRQVNFYGKLELFPVGNILLPNEELNAQVKIHDLAKLGNTKVNLSYFVKIVKNY